MMKKQEHILLIEDNQADADLFFEYISETKYNDADIRHAESIKQSLALLAAHRFDIILLDLALPDSTGLSSLTKILKKSKNSPIVVLSGTDDLKTGEQAVIEGAEDYLVKGTIDENNLNRVITYSIERKKQKLALEKINQQLIASEQELKKEKIFSEKIVENANAIIVGLDKDNIIRIFNQGAENITGYKKDELIGKDWFKTFCQNEILDEMKKVWGNAWGTQSHSYINSILAKSREQRIISWQATGIYDSDDINEHILIAIGEDITERKQVERDLEKAFNGTIEVISRIQGLRDAYTEGHQRRVNQFALEIARKLNLSEEKVKGLEVASRIHDIGKVVIPAEILSKPTKLTELEYLYIRQHTTVAYKILKDMDFPWPVEEIAYQHHERLNGSGYPRGLKEDEIMLEAKILAVADVVESMFSHRPYRKGLGLDVAKAEIINNKGKLYDAEVVDACLEILNSDFEFVEIKNTVLEE